MAAVLRTIASHAGQVGLCVTMPDAGFALSAMPWHNVAPRTFAKKSPEVQDMKDQFIIDADAHIRETEEDYASRLPTEISRLRFGLFPTESG